MIYYHVTDECWVEKILCEGLIGNPVVYLTFSPRAARCIRADQERMGEHRGGSVILQVDYPGEVFVDPDTYPLNSAYMVYDDISPSQIRVYYD